MSLLTLSLIAWAILAVMMFALWLVQYRTHNAGTVDVAWAVGTGATGIWFALGAETGLEERRWLIALLT